MITLASIQKWVEKVLEEPFCLAELSRVEILRSERNYPAREPVLAVLAGSISNNYGTFKNWAK